MTPPLLAPYAATTSTAPVPGAWIQEDDILFTVVRDGFFNGRALSAGDVLLCRGEVRSLDEAVIVPVGRGTPQLGTVHDSYLAGPRGEHRSTSRWQVAGRLHTVFPARRASSPRDYTYVQEVYSPDVQQMCLFPQAA